MLRANQLDADRAFVLVVDVQEKLLPLIAGHERVVDAARKLLDGMRPFGLPVLATEQYPKGLGPTGAPIRAASPPCARPSSRSIGRRSSLWASKPTCAFSRPCSIW